MLEREGRLTTEGGVKTEGAWHEGLMHGEMRVENSMGGWVEGYYKMGVAHGFQREFGTKDYRGGRTLLFFGRCYRGVRRGFCWKGGLGGGYLCGIVDREGEFSGEDVAFIYPDFK